MIRPSGFGLKYPTPGGRRPPKAASDGSETKVMAPDSSAARFGDLSPFGRLFEPFGDQYFSLATLKFGYFLGYFSIIVIKTCLNRFLAWFSELWCRCFWILGGLWCRSFEIFKLLWCRSFGVFKNLATFCSNFLAALVSLLWHDFAQFMIVLSLFLSLIKRQLNFVKKLQITSVDESLAMTEKKVVC